MSSGLALIALPRDPGERADPRIVPDIVWIESHFKVRITDSYSTDPVHKAAGEHPLGLAADIVPDFAHGGTWDDVDRLAAYAVKSGTFRWIGYDGRFGTTKAANHGRGNHLHLSWKHTTTTLGGPGKVTTLDVRHAGGILKTIGGIVTAGPHPPGTPGNDPVQGAVNDGLDAAGRAAKAGAQAALQGLWDLAGEQAAKALLWTALVGGGTAMAVYGLIRALGVEQEAKSALRFGAGVATTAAKAAPK
jgi:hypothetical protein